MSKNSTVWCNKGWQPMNFGFVPNKRAWNATMKRLGISPLDEPYPQNSAARVTFFTMKGKTCALVTVAELSPDEKIEFLGLLVHEATHVWQEIQKVMEESAPSEEFEAYSMQAIFQELLEAAIECEVFSF